MIRLCPAAEREILSSVIALLDGGGVQLFDGLMPAEADGSEGARLLATIKFGSPAFDISASGLAVARGLEQVKANASGRAMWARLIDGNERGVIECRVGTADDAEAPITLNTTNIVAGGWVGLRSCSLALLAS